MPAGIITNATTTYPATPYSSKQKPANANARLHLSGTFSGATVQVQFLADGADNIGPATDGWLSINGGAYTELDDDIINLPDSVQIRLLVSGADGSTAIHYNLY